MSNGIIADLAQRVLTEDHLPLEWWEKIEVDALEGAANISSLDMEIFRAKPEVWRAWRARFDAKEVP